MKLQHEIENTCLRTLFLCGTNSLDGLFLTIFIVTVQWTIDSNYLVKFTIDAHSHHIDCRCALIIRCIVTFLVIDPAVTQYLCNDQHKSSVELTTEIDQMMKLLKWWNYSQSGEIIPKLAAWFYAATLGITVIGMWIKSKIQTSYNTESLYRPPFCFLISHIPTNLMITLYVIHRYIVMD